MVLGLAGGIAVLIAWRGLDRSSTEIGWVAIAFCAFVISALRWPYAVERNEMNRSGPDRRTGWRAVGIGIPLYVAAGILLLLAAARVGPGESIAAGLHWAESAALAIGVLLSLIATIVWLGTMGLAGLIGSLITAGRTIAGRRRYGDDAMGWRHGLGGLALLALVAFGLWFLATDAAWLRDVLEPLLDLVDR